MLRKNIFLSGMLIAFATTGSAHADFVSPIYTGANNAYASFYNFALATKEKRLLFAVTVIAPLIASYIRLYTKRCEKSDTTYRWRDLLKVWNIFNADYWKTFDALVIGEPFKLVNITVIEQISDTKSIETEDKKIKNTPKGLLGLFDAYFILQIRDLLRNIENINKLWNFSQGFITGETIKKG